MILDNEALFILEHFPASCSFLIKMEVLQPNMVQTKLSYIPKVSFYICLGLENFLLVDLEWEEWSGGLSESTMGKNLENSLSRPGVGGEEVFPVVLWVRS